MALSQQLADSQVPEALEGKVRFSNLSPSDLLAELARRLRLFPGSSTVPIA
jgi:hypothetical protein